MPIVHDTTHDAPSIARRRDTRRAISVEALVWVLLVGITATSAAWVKERQALPALMKVSEREPAQLPEPPTVLVHPEDVEPAPIGAAADLPELHPQGTRWFDGERVRIAKTVMMRVTAYSPDARSCGKYADGQTATLHSVWTNGMRLVAADPKVLPYRSMISVPGYADGAIVPVLDCGGAIKGMRLDVLYPTHAQARRWGVRDIPVTVWVVDNES